jgi:hypothetical protein
VISSSTPEEGIIMAYTDFAIAGLAILLAAVLIVQYLGRRRRRRNEIGTIPVLAGMAMERHGITPADIAEAAQEHSVDAAARECTSCGNVAGCRQWLAETGENDASFEHCPNLALFKKTRAYKDALAASGSSTM